MKERLIKKMVVSQQLVQALKGVTNETNEDYLFYKAEDSSATPEQFIQEIVKIGKLQYSSNKQIKAVRDYYHCDKETAILLHKFTDAYIFINVHLEDTKKDELEK